MRPLARAQVLLGEAAEVGGGLVVVGVRVRQQPGQRRVLRRGDRTARQPDHRRERVLVGSGPVAEQPEQVLRERGEQAGLTGVEVGGDARPDGA